MSRSGGRYELVIDHHHARHHERPERRRPVARLSLLRFGRRRRGISSRVVALRLGWSRHDRGHTGDNMTLTDVAGATADRRDAVTTVASLARGWAQRSPTQVSIREKDFGIWREYTWEQTWELIEDAAHGLLALGVAPGDRVSIHCEDRPEWIILDLATVAVRGITVGLYPTNPTAEVEYLLADSRRQDPPRRGPGAGRQGVPDRPPADPRPAADHLRRATGPGRRRRRSAPVLGRTSWSSVASTSVQHPDAVTARWRRPNPTT